MSDLLESLLIFLVIIVIIIAPAIIVGNICVKHEHEKDINTYNNGICECGGNYKFINYTDGHIRDTFVFQCDSCNKIVGFRTNPLE